MRNWGCVATSEEIELGEFIDEASGKSPRFIAKSQSIFLGLIGVRLGYKPLDCIPV